VFLKDWKFFDEEGDMNITQFAEKLKKVALSANSDFFGNTSWPSETAANSMSEPEGRVLNLQ
jgi:hypothetical protein